MTPDIDPIACWMSTASSSRRPSLPLRDRPWAAPDHEVEREIDARIAAELIKRGGEVVIKNRYSVWIAEDGWSVDVFGGLNAPLIVAEAERSGPVTNLTIPKFCVTEITDQARFNNDGLAAKPFSTWPTTLKRSWLWTGHGSSSISGKTGWRNSQLSRN